MEKTNLTEDAFSAGTLSGRVQAYSLVGGRCSAAEIDSLLEIREQKLYLTLEPTWEAFCKNRLGASRYTVERRIHLFLELGAQYERFSSFVRIKPAEYRLIADAVSEDGLSYNGAVIPLETGSAPQLGQAVEALRRDRTPKIPPPDPAGESFAKAERSLQAAIAAFSRLQSMDLDEEGRLRLLIAIETGCESLKNLGSRTIL